MDSDIAEKAEVVPSPLEESGHVDCSGPGNFLGIHHCTEL